MKWLWVFLQWLFLIAVIVATYPIFAVFNFLGNLVWHLRLRLTVISDLKFFVESFKFNMHPKEWWLRKDPQGFTNNI
jgi:hypothetical protein